MKLPCCFSYWIVRVMTIQTLVFDKVQILLFITHMSLNKLKCHKFLLLSSERSIIPEVFVFNCWLSE